MTHIYNHLRHFKRSEFSNPDAMSPELLLKLDWARHQAEIPFHLTSTYRANDARNHGKGLAVDIACLTGQYRLIMVKSLLYVGIERIGIYPKHIHADIEVGNPAIWPGNYPQEISP